MALLYDPAFPSCMVDYDCPTGSYEVFRINRYSTEDLFCFRKSLTKQLHRNVVLPFGASSLRPAWVMDGLDLVKVDLEYRSRSQESEFDAQLARDY
jgi:hypothetical protein